MSFFWICSSLAGAGKNWLLPYQSWTWFSLSFHSETSVTLGMRLPCSPRASATKCGDQKKKSCVFLESARQWQTLDGDNRAECTFSLAKNQLRRQNQLGRAVAKQVHPTSWQRSGKSPVMPSLLRAFVFKALPHAERISSNFP